MSGRAAHRRAEWARARAGAAVLVSVVLLASSCSSAGGSPDDWSRSFVSTRERVFEAALDSLEAIDFYLETADEPSGRIRARASVRRGDQVTLLVRVSERASSIRVDVMAQGPGAADDRAPGRMSAAVTEFLSDLDARLEGRAD